MRALDRKLLRDLWDMKGQALAIALVIAGGIATYVMSASTLDSLRVMRSAYYRDYRFADVFVSLKRAPETLRGRIAEIPGVEAVETRIAAPATIEIEGFNGLITGQLISVPEGGQPLLNALYLRRGRLVEPGRESEAVVSEAFAGAHGLKPGDRVVAVINGRRKTLDIVGIALSPEFIFQIRPGGAFPDFARFGVMWMGYQALSAANGMKGSFNDATLKLAGGANPEDVIAALDDVTRPYGGLGAYGRKDQVSHFYLSEEFKQLDRMGVIFPVIFLGVSAFLLNIVVNRLVNTQREQIAVLKAFGYDNSSIAAHYLKLVLAVTLLGAAGGIAVGERLGRGLSGMYMEFYRFPSLVYELKPGVAAVAALVSAAAAVSGTLASVRSAALLAPATAMRPEPPAVYRESLVERMGLGRLISQPGRMIIRNIERRPMKAMLSVTGIALACAILMAGIFFGDAIDYIVEVQFGLSQRDDLSVSFTEPASIRALHELRGLRGVEYAEPYRYVPVRLRYGHRSYRTAIQGYEKDADLNRLLDTELKPVGLYPGGVVLTRRLADILRVRPGDNLTVEVLEGGRPVREVQVSALVKQYIGVAAYMERGSLNRLMREGDEISGANLAIDPAYRNEIYRAVKGMPRVSGVAARKDSIRNFYDTMARQALIFTSFNTLLAASIAFGVVYNSARISLSERSRELASLRVLGFTRAEISYILLGELALLTVAAVPLGFLIGRAICAYLAYALQTDLYSIPLVIEARTYAFSASVVLASACVSGLIVRRGLDRLDLVAVLKERE